MSRLILSEGTVSVNNLSTLSLTEDTSLSNGSLASVISLLDVFYLDKSSTATIDGITVLATKSGSGRWVRLIVNNKQWANQATWYVDYNTGNDENKGDNISFPIKNLGEWYRRVGGNQITNMTVHILSDMPTTNDVAVGEINVIGNLTITGELGLVPLYSGTLTSVTACNPSANIPWSVTDSAMPSDGYWGTFLGNLTGNRVRITDGYQPGNIFWIAKDLNVSGSPKSCRVSQPSIPYTANTNLQSYGTIQAGDSYVIERMPRFRNFGLRVNCSNTSLDKCFILKDLRISNSTSADFSGSSQNHGMYSIYNCEIGVFMFPGTSQSFINCKFNRLEHRRGDHCVIIGGLFLPFFSGYRRGVFEKKFLIDGRFMVQSANIGVYSDTISFISSLQMFESPEYQGIGVWQTGNLILQSSIFPLEIFGKDNAGVGIRIQPGGKIQYSPNLNTVTITGNYADVGIGYTANSGADNRYSYSEFPMVHIGQTTENGVTKVISIASFFEE